MKEKLNAYLLRLFWKSVKIDKRRAYIYSEHKRVGCAKYFLTSKEPAKQHQFKVEDNNYLISWLRGRACMQGRRLKIQMRQKLL